MLYTFLKVHLWNILHLKYFIKEGNINYRNKIDVLINEINLFILVTKGHMLWLI